jgi:hypothetical protein
VPSDFTKNWDFKLPLGHKGAPHVADVLAAMRQLFPGDEVALVSRGRGAESGGNVHGSWGTVLTETIYLNRHRTRKVSFTSNRQSAHPTVSGMASF